MNRRVLILTTLICLGIIIACVIAGSTYYARITIPVGLTQELIQTQGAATTTSLNLLATDSAIKTLSAMPTPTPLPTLTLVPTFTVVPTLPPQQEVCDAIVQGTSRAVYPFPGLGHSLFINLLEVGTKLKVLGRIGDNDWYKVEVNSEQGWMKSDSLRVLNSCKPTLFDLHYLANWLNQDENLILEDTFSANANIWVDTESQESILVSTTSAGESALNIQAINERVITTTNPRVSDVPEFKLYTSFTVEKASGQSSFGIRFRDSGTEYYQISLSPSTCKVDVYTTSKLVYSNNMNLKTCIDRYYDIYMVMSSDYKLAIQINGFDPISINLQDTDGRYGHGKIDLVANNIDVKLDYIVVTSPK